MTRNLFSIVILAMTPLCAFAQAPSTAAIRAAIDRGEHQEAVTMVEQARRAAGKAAGGPERYELSMLKGDALLGGGSPGYAAEAYGHAMHVAGDREQRAAARAAGILARKAANRPAGEAVAADGGGGEAGQPKAEARKAAMRELYADLRRQVEPKVRDAAAGTTLPPMYELLPSLADLAALELTADGSVERTLPLLKQLGARARELVGDELRRVDARISELEAAAGEIQVVGGRGFVGRRGLHTNDRKALEEAVTYLARIEAVTRDGRRIAELIEDQEAAANWKHLDAAASDAATHARSLLERRW